MKYKVGDSVRILNDELIRNLWWAKPYINQITVITRFNTWGYEIAIDNGQSFWHESWLSINKHRILKLKRILNERI